MHTGNILFRINSMVQNLVFAVMGSKGRDPDTNTALPTSHLSWRTNSSAFRVRWFSDTKLVSIFPMISCPSLFLWTIYSWTIHANWFFQNIKLGGWCGSGANHVWLDCCWYCPNFKTCFPARNQSADKIMTLMLIMRFICFYFQVKMIFVRSGNV